MSTALASHASPALSPDLGHAPAAATAKQPPLLLLFASKTDGPSRRLDGFVAHVVQRRHNHDSFRYRTVIQEDRPDLFDRFHVEHAPALMVIDDKQVAARMDGFQRPADVESMLAPWLKR